MRSLPTYGLGMVFVLVGIAFLALSWRKAKPASLPVKKSELRQEAALRSDARKLRIAAGIMAGLGILLIALS